jgi:hypothetical protein
VTAAKLASIDVAFLETAMPKLELAEFSPDEPPSSATLAGALERMEEALQILDNLAAPADIGAHLDLALHRLRQEIGCLPA